MVMLEISPEGARLRLTFTTPDGDRVELVMSGDEARQLVNNLGEAILSVSRTTGVMT